MTLALIIVLAASTTAAAPPSRILVATVLERPIFADQLEAREAGADQGLEPARVERLESLIVAPLKARFCAKHGCTATEAEMRTLRESIQRANVKTRQAIEERRATLTRDLSAPGVTAERRKEIAERLTKLDQALPLWSGDELARAAAEYMVESWKFNKALHDRYGGRVIWQPMGLNAVGAFHGWLEEEERAEAFRIIPRDLRASFWESVSSDGGRPVDDPHPFATPPWVSSDSESP